MSDRYLLIGTSYILSPDRFELLLEVRPKKQHISPTKYLEKLHKQGNFKPGHRKNFSSDITISNSNFSVRESPTKVHNKIAVSTEKKADSPHFAEDISFINNVNNKSNTYYDIEAATLLETISTNREKDPRKLSRHPSDIKESSEETNDRSKNNITAATEDKVRTAKLPNRKKTGGGFMTEEEEKQSACLNKSITPLKNEQRQSIHEKNGRISTENEKDTRNRINPERRNTGENNKKPNADPKVLENPKATDLSQKNVDLPIEKVNKEENQGKAQNLLNPKPVVQPKIIDRAGAKLRKEEFERRMKEKNANENKLQSFKQKFSAAPPIKEQLNEEPPVNNILTPKELNIPLPQEKKLDLESLDEILKKKLEDLQKKDETSANELTKEENGKESKDKPISLQDYRNQLKSKKTLNEAKEDKYVINNRGQRINKNLLGLIDHLEKTLGGKSSTKEEEPQTNLEHITMERSKMGQKRMKSKNSDFFDLI